MQKALLSMIAACTAARRLTLTSSAAGSSDNELTEVAVIAWGLPARSRLVTTHTDDAMRRIADLSCSAVDCGDVVVCIM